MDHNDLNHSDENKTFGIMLNGSSSAGKTSLCNRIRAILDEPTIFQGIDHVWKLFGPKYSQCSDYGFTFNDLPKDKLSHGGFGFINQNGAIIDRTGIIGEAAMVCFLKTLQTYYANGLNFVSDYIIEDKDFLYRMAIEYHNLNVYFIGVYCDLDKLKKREIDRKDRFIGATENHFNRIHNYDLMEYDLILDTSNTELDNLDKLAYTVINHIKKQKPKAFNNIFKNIINNNIKLSRFEKRVYHPNLFSENSNKESKDVNINEFSTDIETN